MVKLIVPAIFTAAALGYAAVAPNCMWSMVCVAAAGAGGVLIAMIAGQGSDERERQGKTGR